MNDSKHIIKDFLFKVKPIHIIITVVLTILVILFLAGKVLAYFAATHNALVVIIILSVFFLVSRLSVLTQVGIGFLTFIMFPMMIVFGPWVNLAMVWSTTAIFCWIAAKPTPVDFAINKNIMSSVAQGIYITLWTGAMVIFLKFISLEYIMAHLTFTYMMSVLIYTIFMVITLPIMAKQPVPIVIINGIMMFPVQWVLIIFLGPKFMTYMLTFM